MEIASEDENDAVSTNSNSADCPLFMEGLPRDFSSNPALAALASLIDEESIAKQKIANKALSTQKKEDKTPKKRRHDVKNFKSKSNLTGSKERSASTSTSEDQVLPPTGQYSSPSIGEASLFLKMWKL